MKAPKEFSHSLKNKISRVRETFESTQLGNLKFPSKIVQAPMAGICSIPYRLLMEELGAGFTVSELISCHGINHGNERTLNMLKLHEREHYAGLQLFGEEPDAMASAAKKMEEYNPMFIDINMGCPVRKVVTKGGGAALLQNPEELRVFFSTIKDAIKVPLTIKIRTGWDEEHINAHEVIDIAKSCEIEWVAIHGRTRTQQYTGFADWSYLESLGAESVLPIIGNGDLHTPKQVQKRMQDTNCQALMIARGSIRNPFIFLESYIEGNEKLRDIVFTGEDYFEVIERLAFYTEQTFDHERTRLVQLRKFVAWFAAGFSGAAKFRGEVFQSKDFSETVKLADKYFNNLSSRSTKQIPEEKFMTSGHG